MDTYPCPCCGFLTMNEEPPGSFDICPVCYWEDDIAQYNNPDLRGGANEVSLKEARSNYCLFGASSPKFLDVVRPPLQQEVPSSRPCE